MSQNRKQNQGEFWRRNKMCAAYNVIWFWWSMLRKIYYTNKKKTVTRSVLFHSEILSTMFSNQIRRRLIWLLTYKAWVAQGSVYHWAISKPVICNRYNLNQRHSNSDICRGCWRWSWLRTQSQYEHQKIHRVISTSFKTGLNNWKST